MAVLDALELIARYASAGNLRYYPAGEAVPVHRGLGGDWDALVYADDARRRRRVVRMVYAADGWCCCCRIPAPTAT